MIDYTVQLEQPVRWLIISIRKRICSGGLGDAVPVISAMKIPVLSASHYFGLHFSLKIILTGFLSEKMPE